MKERGIKSGSPIVKLQPSMLKVALRHFLNPSFLLLGSVMILPACTFSSSLFAPPVEAERSSSLLAALEYLPVTALTPNLAHLPARGAESERHAPSSFLLPPTLSLACYRRACSEFNNGLEAPVSKPAVNQCKTTKSINQLYLSNPCVGVSTQLKKDERLDLAVIYPLTLLVFPAMLQPLLLWLPFLMGISDLQQIVLIFQPFKYNQRVLIIRETMNQPKITVHNPSSTTCTNSKSPKTQLAAECKSLSVSKNASDCGKTTKVIQQ